MKKRFLWIMAIVFMLFFATDGLLVEKGWGDVNWGSGSISTGQPAYTSGSTCEGDNCCTGTDCPEPDPCPDLGFCCTDDAIEKGYCPHWIKVDKGVYNSILDTESFVTYVSFPYGNKYSEIRYSGLDSCKSDDYVIIKGNLFGANKSGFYSLEEYIRNYEDYGNDFNNSICYNANLFNNTNSNSNSAYCLVNKLNIDIVSSISPSDSVLSEAYSNNNSIGVLGKFNYTSFRTIINKTTEMVKTMECEYYDNGEWPTCDYVDVPKIVYKSIEGDDNFFNQKVIYNGKETDKTWGEVLDEVLEKTGLDESNIASFCYSMIDDGPETNSDNTTVKAEVKNYTVGTDWSKETYAKPGDKVGWQHTYVPGAQKFYNEHCVNNSSNACKNWQNKFDIIEYDNDDENKARLIYSEGNLGNKIEEKTYPSDSSFNGYTSLSKDSVGKKITQKITSGTPIAASDSNGNITITDEGPATDSASVYVPYNFVNTISIKGDEPVLYAGEAMPLSVEIKTEGKTNTLTGVNSSNKYATVVPVAKVRSKVYIKGQESSSKTLTKTLSGGLNKGGNKNGSLESTSVSVVVDDVLAGTEYCVKVGVYPASSGSDNNWNNSNGDGQWSESQEKCVKVAKKPSLQVWGAGVYSNGKIELQDAKKKKVGGETISDGVIAFGSFAEQNIVTFGRIKNFASGAATGGPGLTDRTKTVNGEKISGSFLKTNEVTISNCVLDPLTMPNSGCGTNGSGSAVSGFGSNNVDLKAFAESFESDKSETIETCSISLEPNLDKDKIYICNGDFAISSNITYPKEGYTSLEEIPKVIIYAENNINIACNVTNIDAVLITKGNVNTCSNSDNENDEIRSNQLKINGAVITGKLLANRTYGAATGKYSGIPAEIIDFDVSLYLHNAPKVDANGSDKLEVVMINEMAPRY